MTSASISVHSLYRDLYPRPGERIKQWVVDSRRLSVWDSETCLRVDVVEHKDNTGADCRNNTAAAWRDLEIHDCCHVCGDAADFWRRNDPRIEQWLSERERYHAAHPVCPDRAQLSDETQEDFSLRGHPTLDMLRSSP